MVGMAMVEGETAMEMVVEGVEGETAGRGGPLLARCARYPC